MRQTKQVQRELDLVCVAGLTTTVEDEGTTHSRPPPADVLAISSTSPVTHRETVDPLLCRPCYTPTSSPCRRSRSRSGYRDSDTRMPTRGNAYRKRCTAFRSPFLSLLD